MKQPTIELRPADPDWPNAYAAVAREITNLLGSSVRVEHVGSTAVRGLSAKPIIDILVGVLEKHSLSDVGQALRTLEYSQSDVDNPRAEGAFFHRGAKQGSQAVNLHLTTFNSQQWRSLTRFRDVLRADAALRLKYENLKERLAAASNNDLEYYTSGKTDFVQSVIGFGDG